MLTFVGLGLHDERSITIEGRDAIASAERVVAELYTSRLSITIDELESFHGVTIDVLSREAVEIDPRTVLDDAATNDVVFLTGGDPMISTTHIDLRLRAIDRGIETRVIHGPSIATAAPGITGLQNYRFGKATTIPFPGTFDADIPASVIDTIRDNRTRGLHTLLYLDLDETGDESLSASTAVDVLVPEFGDELGVVVARAGSETPLVEADRLSNLAARSFGTGLHVVIIPADLHPMEADALKLLGDAPEDLLETA